MPTILTVNDHTPDVSRAAFVADDAVIAGNVVLGEGVSVWFGCVLRAEYSHIRIGARSNVQDGTIVHADPGAPVEVGEDVTIGHRVVLHGATVEDAALVGMGAVVLNGATVGAGAIVGAGAVVREGTTVPAHALAVGVPAVVKKDVVDPDDLPPHNVAAYEHLSDLYTDTDE